LKGFYYTRGRQVKIGRLAYVIGYWTDGTLASQLPLLFSWDLDNKVAKQLTPPPAPGPQMRDNMIRPAAGGAKIVWPFCMGPEGYIDGIYVYTPSTDSWAIDRQVPSYGNFIGNSVVELPGNRIGFCGASLGTKQQTNFWMYQPA